MTEWTKQEGPLQPTGPGAPGGAFGSVWATHRTRSLGSCWHIPGGSRRMPARVRVLQGSRDGAGGKTDSGLGNRAPVTPGPCLGGGGGGRRGRSRAGAAEGGQPGAGAGRRHRQESHSQGLQAHGAFEVWELLNVRGSIQGPGNRASSSEGGARACPCHSQPPSLPTDPCSPPAPLYRPSSLALVEARHG